MESPDLSTSRRRSLQSVTDEDRAQAESVSVRRIVRLFTPYRRR